MQLGYIRDLSGSPNSNGRHACFLKLEVTRYLANTWFGRARASDEVGFGVLRSHDQRCRCKKNEARVFSSRRLGVLGYLIDSAPSGPSSNSPVTLLTTTILKPAVGEIWYTSAVEAGNNTKEAAFSLFEIRTLES